MKNSGFYRSQARTMLGGNAFGEKWLYALLMVALASIVSGIASTTGVLTLVVAGPIAAGLAAVFLKASREGAKADFDSLLWSTKDGRLVKTIVLGVMQWLFVLLWTMLFIIPGIVKSYAYSMAYYIQHDHPEYDWQQCITESRKLMAGKKMKLFLLDLSFIGWYIVSIFTCGLGLLWVAPYTHAARAAFYEDIKPEAIIVIEAPAEEATEA